MVSPMPTTVHDLMGRRVTLTIRRFGSPGAFLGVDANETSADAATVLLPNAEVPAGAKAGDAVEVFVHLDAEERPVATTRPVRLVLGEVAFLTITATTEIGAFADWGPGKELLVPFAQQSKELHAGERQPIGLYLDKTGRPAGTMLVGELLDARPEGFARDAWVAGEAWRNDPDIGLFVIVERRCVGLVPASEPHRLGRGEAARFRVADVLPDGKLVLSLRQHAHQEIEGDAAKILAAIVAGAKGAAKVSERASPEEIRDRFGLSKKAFKRAVGRLLAERAVAIDAAGFLVVAPARRK
jgi:predicted RNA-binding protein (virulence factor B family)